jgi:hypothetical protein
LMNLTYNLFRFEQITRLSKKRIDIPKLEKVEALT